MLMTADTSTLVLPKRILVIDDEESIRHLLDEYLEIIGFEVHSVASGPEGLKALANGEFGLIICDVSMPGMDGFQVYEETVKSKPDQQFLFITGYNYAGSRENLVEKSLGLLRKPFHLNDLHAFISSIYPEIQKV